MSAKTVLYLFDATATIHRAYHAIRGLSTSTGVPTNAVFGFTRALINLIHDRSPEYIALCFDSKEKTFRHDMFPGYKATRPPMPDDMRMQLPYIRQVVEGFRLPVIELPGFEADDLIGTLAVRAEKAGYSVVMVTGDKDFVQLVTENVSIWDPMKAKATTLATVRESGLEPSQFIEVMGLSGDTSDNVPGVPGIGQKTAQLLIQQFGSMDQVYDRIDEVASKTVRQKLLDNRNQAFLTRFLVTIRTDIPLTVNMDNFRMPTQDTAALADLFKTLEFRQLQQEYAGSEYLSKTLKVNIPESMNKPLGLSFSVKTVEPFYDVARTQLQYIVGRYGISICEDARRCEAMLRDLCPDCKREIHVLVNAIREDIPQELIRASKDIPKELLLTELSKRLYDNLGIKDDLARWAVESWDALLDSNKEELFIPSGHSSSVTSVAFSPDGCLSISGSEDWTLKLWDVATGEEIRTFKGHSRGVTSVAFSPDGRMVLSGSKDKTLKLWDIAMGMEIRTFKEPFPVNSVAFSPDGLMALSGSGDNTLSTLKLWDIATGMEIRTFKRHSSHVRSVAFSPDGRMVLSGSCDSTLKLWDVATGMEIRTFKEPFPVDSVAFSPDGCMALSGSWDRTLKLWDIATGKEIRTFTGHSSFVNSVAFSLGGNLALSGSYDNTLKLWGIASGEVIRTFEGHSSEVTSAVFSPDNRMALSGSTDKTLKLWNIATGEVIRTFNRHSYNVTSVAFSPDGHFVLSGIDDDSTLKLWDIATGEVIRTFTETIPVGSVAFSPDGCVALSGSMGDHDVADDSTLKLWDVATGKEIRVFEGYFDFIDSVTFSPDGRMALLGSWDKTLKLWDIAYR